MIEVDKCTITRFPAPVLGEIAKPVKEVNDNIRQLADKMLDIMVETKGIGLAGISYDSREILADFTKRNGITFPLLSDVGSATITRYGILNTVVEEALGPNGKDPAVLADLQRYVTGAQVSERLRGIPFPGTFMLDRQGRVTIALC